MKKWYSSLPENKKLVVQASTFMVVMVILLIVATLIEKGV